MVRRLFRFRNFVYGIFNALLSFFDREESKSSLKLFLDSVGTAFPFGFCVLSYHKTSSQSKHRAKVWDLSLCGSSEGGGLELPEEQSFKSSLAKNDHYNLCRILYKAICPASHAVKDHRGWIKIYESRLGRADRDGTPPPRAPSLNFMLRRYISPALQLIQQRAGSVTFFF